MTYYRPRSSNHCSNVCVLLQKFQKQMLAVSELSAIITLLYEWCVLYSHCSIFGHTNKWVGIDYNLQGIKYVYGQELDLDIRFL